MILIALAVLIIIKDDVRPKWSTQSVALPVSSDFKALYKCLIIIIIIFLYPR